MTATKSKTVAQNRWQHHHPALIVGDRLRARVKREEAMLCFYEQCPADSACGAMAVASACVILGLAKSYAITESSNRKSGVPHAFFQAFKDTWFEGCGHEDMVRRILMMKLPVSVGFRFIGSNDLETFATSNLTRGELVMMAFRSVKSSKTNHWALGVGTEGEMVNGRRIVDTLLLLDPSAQDPQYRVWNARLRLNESVVSRTNRTNSTTAKRVKQITWWYDSAQWAPELVRLEAAIRIKRNVL